MNPLKKSFKSRSNTRSNSREKTRNKVIENMKPITIVRKGPTFIPKKKSVRRKSSTALGSQRQTSGDITSQTDTMYAAPSPRILKHSSARPTSNRASSTGREVVKFKTQTQTLSDSSSCRASANDNHTGRLSSPRNQHETIEAMSELNQDLKITNHDIGRSPAFKVAKAKLREGLSCNSRTSNTSRERVTRPGLTDELKEEVTEYCTDVNEMRN